MKNFIRNLMVMMFLGTFSLTSLQAQTVVQIGNGTSTTYRYPLNMFYCYSWNRMLYLSSEIGNSSAPVRITKIAFQYSYGTSYNMTNQTCYLEATTATSLSAGYINPSSSGATQVWTGTLNCVQGWVEITLQTPFILPAGSNLHLHWHHNMGTYPGSSYTFYYTSATNMAVDAYSDASFPSGSSGSVTAYRPNTRITWMPLGRSAAVTEITSPSSNRIAWTANLQASAKIANIGVDTITSCRVNWKVNNVSQTPINYANALIAGANPVTINLGTFTPDSNALNNMTVWVDNALPYDSIPSDDTMSFDFYTCTYLLNGNYTIGGSGADFTTVGDAVDHLMNCGVSGPTTFLINSGTYVESMNMTGAIPGASTTNLVTFTSVAGNADSVQIYASGTTWFLSEISHLRFKDITIGTLSSVGEKALVLDGNCSNIEFYRCNIYAYTSATASSYIPVYYSNSIGGKCLTNVKFIKNKISGGFINMCFFTPNSSNANYMGSVTIDSNLMTEGYRGGLARSLEYTSTYYMYFPSISYNTIIGRTGNTNYQYGICLGSVNTNPSTYGYYDNVGQIVGNKIKIQATGNYTCGILLSVYQNYYSPTGSSGGGTQCLVANNEIIHATGDYCSSYGIYAYYSKANIINNSIGLQNTSTSYDLYGIWIYNTSTSYGPMTIKNNNIAVNAADPSRGYPIYFQDGPSYATSSYKIMDYNNYYSTGSNIAYIGAAISDLPSLRSTTQQDANSVSIEPSFVDLPNSLKVYGLDLSCPVHSSVLTDMENITRNSTTIMGAYEFVPSVPLDIQPFALVTPSTVVTNGIDEVVSIQMINVGTDTVTSATINWSFNGVAQTPVAWTGSLPSRNTVLVTLDTITPISGTNSLVFITSLPNSQVDTIRFNDTLTVSLYGCDSLLNGVYTIGGGGDFATLEAAFGELMHCGVNGPVELQLISGNYDPLTVSGTIPGADQVNTITITSVSGNASNVVIGGNSSSSYTTALTLDGVSHLIFKDVTIGMNSTLIGTAVELKGMCEDVLFEDCNIQAYTSATSSNYCGVRYYNGSGATNTLRNVRFIGNTIDGGYASIYFYYPAGNNGNMSAAGMSVTIENNIMSNSYYYGIYSYYYARYEKISNNTITSRTSGSVTSNWYGMYLYYYHNVEEIVGNKIRSTHTSITSPRGIYTYYYFNYTSYSGSGSCIIANNEIILHGAYTSATYNYFCGMYIYNPYSTVNISHNSIYLYRTSSSTTYGSGIFTYTTSTSYPIHVRNNNVVTSLTSGGTSYYIYPYYVASATYCTSTYGTRNYNNYFNTNSSNIAYTGAVRTLATLRSTHSQDANSTNMNPGFVAASTDLIPSTWSSCPVLTDVPYDINGMPRTASNNYKGCYIQTFMYDAGLTEFKSPSTKSIAGVSTPVSVKLVNFGQVNLTSVTIVWSVKGVSQTPLTVTGLNLPQFKDTVIVLGSYIPDSGVFNAVKAYTYLPNGTADLNPLNDTIDINSFGCEMILNGVYDVAGGNNDFATINDVMSTLENCGVSGPVTIRLATGTYNAFNSISGTFPGVSSNNTITFTSLTGDADDVVIGAASGTALELDGAENLRFTNLTIGNNATTYGIEFFNSNTNIEFYQCNILSSPTTSSTSYACVRYYSSSGSTNLLRDIRFIKNHLNGGYYNFYLYYPAGGSGNIGSSGMSVIIDSNLMTNAYYYGIYSYYYGRYPSISYNTITSRNSGTVSSTWYGIYLYYYHNVDAIVGNRIHSTNPSIMYPTGIRTYYYFNYTSYGGSGAGLIANNEIILYTTSSYYGMYIYNPYSNVNVLHNSVYMYGTGGAYGFYTYNSSTSYQPVIKNNSFVIEAGASAYPIYYNGNYFNTSYFTVDYNNYYSSGTYVGYAGSGQTVLSGLQSATGQDVNSMSLLPNFTDTNAVYQNLRTDGFEMLLQAINDVPVDIDNVSRTAMMNITNMGCYHDFEPANVDAKMEEIVSPLTSLTTGQQTALTVKVGNLGINNLDSVNIHWVVNGIETVYNWYGSLSFGNKSSNVTLGNFIPLSGPNTITVFTTNPNGVQDENTKNDTLSIVLYGCDSLLNGIYVVGANGDFATSEIAMAMLLNCGINGAVELRFEAGTYDALNFDREIYGSSALSTVTFTSLSGNAASVSFASIGGVALNLDGVSNLIFKNIIFDAEMGTYGVEFKNTCSNILFYGCNIKADPLSTSSTNIAVRYYNSSGSGKYLQDVRFIKNNISGGYYNFYLYYPGSGSTEMSNGSASITIDSNTITDAYYYGIYSYYYGFYPSISYNTITSRSSSGGYYGIYTYYYHTIPLMVGNKIHVNCSSTGYGMHLYYYHNYSTSYGSNGPGILANNEIIINGAGTKYGMYIYNNSRWDVANNSIYIGSAASTAYGIYDYNTSTSYLINVINNNIVTASTGTTYPLYISTATYATSAYGIIDYNNYYSNGSYLGYIGSAMTTLAAMKAYQNTNSVNIAPSYIDVSTSLEMSDYSGVLCPRDASVLYDINGDNRTTLTPMGAYSVYVFEGYNMGINAVVEPINTDEVFCYQDYASIVIAMANKGSLPIDFTSTPMVLHVDVQGIVNFQADTIISVGSLSATMKDTFVITDFLPVNLSGSYNIKVWLELAIDQLSSDDTIESVYIIDKISIPYNINFDTMPRGLVFRQLAGNSGWTVESGDGVNPTISPSHGSGRLQFLSESGRGSMASVTLQPFNLQGSSSPQMKFWYAHDNNNPMARDYTEVKISVDGGFNYSTLMHIQRYDAAYATPTFVRYEIDLSPYTAYSCVILAFEAGSYGGGNQNIDSIALISKQDIAVELEVSDQSEFVACELDNKEINVKLTNMTAQVFNFGNNPSQINVEISGVVDTLFTIPLLSGTMEGDTMVMYTITNTFDFSINGTYDIVAYLASADDNTFNDTARQTRIVQVDAALLAVDPIASKDVGDLVSPTVYVSNNGNMPINQIDLIITINNVEVVWETIDTLLNPGDSISYTFIQAYTVPNATEQQPYYQMKIAIDLPCDGILGNNSHSTYYNVNIEGSIDLAITEIYHPEADSCKPGFTKIYPSIEVYNGGTGYAQGATLYVLVDSLGVIIQTFSEVLDDVVGQGTITYNCSKYYSVPNFKGNYTLSFNIVFPKDVNNANNSKSVVTCSEEVVSVIAVDAELCSLGQNIPNPATSNTLIPYTIPQEGKVSFKVMSVNGQILYNKEIEASSGTHYVELNTAGLSNGIYYYSMEYQGQRIVKKMTIQK